MAGCDGKGEREQSEEKNNLPTNHAAQPEIILLIILTAFKKGAKLIP